MTNRGLFREFYARFFMNARFVLRSAGVFSRYCTVCTRGHAHNSLFKSSALIGQCLNSWRVTFRTHITRSMHIARSILSSFPYYILLIIRLLFTIQFLDCGGNSCSYSYTIALSGLFELYTRGGHLNHEANQSGLKARLECTIK